MRAVAVSYEYEKLAERVEEQTADEASPQGSCVDPDPSDEGELSSLGEGRRLGGNASKLSVSRA
jgi:hypothetical protein